MKLRGRSVRCPQRITGDVLVTCTNALRTAHSIAFGFRRFFGSIRLHVRSCRTRGVSCCEAARCCVGNSAQSYTAVDPVPVRPLHRGVARPGERRFCGAANEFRSRTYLGCVRLRLRRVSLNYFAAIPCAPSGSPPSVSIKVRLPSNSTRKETTDCKPPASTYRKWLLLFRAMSIGALFAPVSPATELIKLSVPSPLPRP